MMNDKEHKNDYTATGVAIVKAEKKWAQARQEKIQSFIRQNPTSIVAFDQLVGLLSNFTVDFTAAQIDEMRGWVADAWQGTPQLNQLDSIVSVSVDEKEADWQKAMKEEKMTWTQARIADGIMGENVKKYNITGIPTCPILDGEGRFYKTNTRGAYLDEFLMELYGK